MFFKQVWRNAIRHRKDNGLFFGSLIIAIIAFYTLLSLKEQDVMRYLAAVESVAVSKLFKLIPLVYMVSLFFVFFLVYFACKYQTDSRRKEFGMYLMLGMKYSRLFAILFCETFLNSLISLLTGIPLLIIALLTGIPRLIIVLMPAIIALLLKICIWLLIKLIVHIFPSGPFRLSILFSPCLSADSLRKTHLFLYFTQGFIGKIRRFLPVFLDHTVNVILVLSKFLVSLLQRL